MKHVRLVIDQLVERRLWPVAAALLAGLVLVPVALSKKGSAPTPVPPAPPANVPSIASPDDAAAVALKPGSGRWLRQLSKHDPFVQRVKKSGNASTTEISSGAHIGGGTSGGAIGTVAPVTPPASGGGGGGTVTVPHGGSPSVPKAATLSLRFGKVSGSLASYALQPMEALPRKGDPVIIYVGLVKGTKTAVFIVPVNVKAEGDGRCVPSPKNCQTVHVAPGDTEFFDYTTDTGLVVQYQLDYLGVQMKPAKSPSAAKQSYVGTTKSDRRALRQGLEQRGLGPAIAKLDFDAAFAPADDAAAPAGDAGSASAGTSPDSGAIVEPKRAWASPR